MTVTTFATEFSETKKSFPITVLLVDDQAIIHEAVLRMLDDQPDVTLHYCSEPAKAMQMALDIAPTLILQDIVMPEFDGITLLRYYRAIEKLKDVPVIMLSGEENAVVKAEAFTAGANDYIVKLPDRIELVARIRYHSTAYIHFLQRNLAYQHLQESQKALHEELEKAASYVRSRLPEKLKGSVITDWRLIPSIELGGDSFGYRWLDSDHFAFYLLDVCGHGVGAALLSITIMNVLNSESLAVDYFDPETVLAKLNNTFPMEEQNNMFFTICYGVYDKKSNLLTYASAAHPPPVIVRILPDGTKSYRNLSAPGGPVIGAMEGLRFPKAVVDVLPGDIIYIFSDGLYELTREDGTVLELSEFVKIFGLFPNAQESKLTEIDRVLAYSKGVMRGNPFADDVAFVEIRIAKELI